MESEDLEDKSTAKGKAKDYATDNTDHVEEGDKMDTEAINRALQIAPSYSYRGCTKTGF